MNATSWFFRGCQGLTLAITGLSGIGTHAADDTPPATPGVQVDADGNVLFQGPVLTPSGTITVRRMSAYWLGIGCSPVSPTLRAKLELGENVGLVIDEVMEGSPAAKAGLKPNDVMLSAGETPLNDANQIVELLDKSKDQELSLSVIRDGEKQTIAVKPEKRPEPTRLEAVGPVRDRVRWMQGEPARAFEQMREQLEQAGGPVRMHFFHPGAVLPQAGMVTAAKFPDDLNVEIKKHGNKPAEITVEQGKEKWSVTEDKLSELPDSVRPHVERLLGRGSPFGIAINAVAPVTGAFTMPVPPPAAGPDRMERRLDEMTRRLEQMRNEVEQMRGKRIEQQPSKPAAEPAGNADETGSPEI